MASIPTQEEVVAATRKSQEAMVAAVKTWLETVRTAAPKLPSKLPQVSLPFADKLPTPQDAVANAYHLAEQLLASQRRFAEDLVKATAPLRPGYRESSPEVPSPSAWQDAVTDSEPKTPAVTAAAKAADSTAPARAAKAADSTAPARPAARLRTARHRLGRRRRARRPGRLRGPRRLSGRPLDPRARRPRARRPRARRVPVLGRARPRVLRIRRGRARGPRLRRRRAPTQAEAPAGWHSARRRRTGAGLPGHRPARGLISLWR